MYGLKSVAAKAATAATVPTPLMSHGRTILEFMIDCDLCMLNGRFGENSNKYTCVSTKGASVVDYVFVPTKHFKMFDTFNVD